MDKSEWEDMNSPFDYSSVMQYGGGSFGDGKTTISYKLGARKDSVPTSCWFWSVYVKTQLYYFLRITFFRLNVSFEHLARVNKLWARTLEFRRWTFTRCATYTSVSDVQVSPYLHMKGKRMKSIWSSVNKHNRNNTSGQTDVWTDGKNVNLAKTKMRKHVKLVSLNFSIVNFLQYHFNKFQKT